MVKDIILKDNDLLIQTGDFVVGESDEQHIELILLSSKGNWRKSPFTGIGLISFLNAPFSIKTVDQMKQRIKLQLQLDGYKEQQIIIQGVDDITINASR